MAAEVKHKYEYIHRDSKNLIVHFDNIAVSLEQDSGRHEVLEFEVALEIDYRRADDHGPEDAPKSTKLIEKIRPLSAVPRLTPPST